MKDRTNNFVLIKGDKNYGKEIIAELERRGGINKYNFSGASQDWYYYINKETKIIECNTIDYCKLILTDYEVVDYVSLKAWHNLSDNPNDLPDTDRDVLAYFDTGDYMIVYYNGKWNFWGELDNVDVIAWREIPQCVM